MIPLEQLPRPFRVAVRSAVFTLVVCTVVSLVPVWWVRDTPGSTKPADDGGFFWEEVATCSTGDRPNPGQFLAITHNFETMALVAGLAFVTGAVAFWFGPRVKDKDKDDEPRRLRVRMWES